MSNFFEGSLEEKQWVTDMLAAMGYQVEEQDLSSFCCAQPAQRPVALSAVKADLAEQGLEAFLHSGESLTLEPRQREAFGRFCRALLEESQRAATDNAQGNDNGDGDERGTAVVVHNFNVEQDLYTVKLRVISGRRFVEYTLQPARHAKLILPKEWSRIDLVSTSKTDDVVPMNKVMRPEEDEVTQGSTIYVCSWKVSKDVGLKAVVGLPVELPDADCSVYHYCPIRQIGTSLDLFHVSPGEQESEAHRKHFHDNSAMVVVPDGSSQVHLRSTFKSPANGEKWQGDRQFPAEDFISRHVYVQTYQDDIFLKRGDKLGEAQKFDAVKDLAKHEGDQKASSAGSEDGFHVVLHNLSPQQEKFRLKVKVTSDHKTADFQLDSHRHTILKLPEGSSLQVETELEKEHCSPLKASAALDAKTLAENGSNVYFWTELDHDSVTEEEDELLCKLCILLLLPPLFCIAMLVVGFKIRARRRQRPLTRLHFQVGPPTAGAAGASGSVWHFLAEGPLSLFLTSDAKRLDLPGGKLLIHRDDGPVLPCASLHFFLPPSHFGNANVSSNRVLSCLGTRVMRHEHQVWLVAQAGHSDVNLVAVSGSLFCS
ncbi:unnamed protein product [Effrenium voratum]|nr:unnamed protein product [Effrenium voratum]